MALVCYCTTFNGKEDGLLGLLVNRVVIQQSLNTTGQQQNNQDQHD